MLCEPALESGSDPTAGGAKVLAETRGAQKASSCDDSAAAGTGSAQWRRL